MMGFDFQLVQPQAFIRMHFIAAFLIKSIIRTRRFNDYDGTERHNPRKKHEPRCRAILRRGSMCFINCTHKNGQEEKEESKKQDKSGF